MIDKAKSVTQKVKNLSILHRHHDLSAGDVSEARLYISEYWRKLERFHPKDDDSMLGLPKPYLVPAFEEGHDFDFNEMYYWDSYFMVQGIMDQSHRPLVEGILDNMVFMFNRYGIIPNESRNYLTGR